MKNYICVVVNFDNTEKAFVSNSNKDLKRAYWLFKLIEKPFLVKLGKWATNIALTVRFPIRRIVKATIFKQFCGGESIEECEKRINRLNKFGIGTILDYSVEGKKDFGSLQHTTDEIIETIKKASDNKKIPYAVFKVTGVARFDILEKANDPMTELLPEDRHELQRVFQRVEDICNAAHENDVPVFIDAEESWIQNTIDRIVMTMMSKFNREKAIVYNTLQMYRHDRLEFLNESINRARMDGFHLGVKLVRGAYMEKERRRAEDLGYEDPIQPDKESSDRDYDKGLELLIENIDICEVCAGTHNENSALYLTKLIKKHELDKNDHRVWFAQLLGMSDHISYNLSLEGYNVAKYVPYGPVREIIPYLIRRAEENTSVKGQTGRELGLIMKEIERRKQAKKEG